MESSMNSGSPTKLILQVLWIGLLSLGAAVVLFLAASRVGEHRSSTYGQAYQDFESSWGGEIFMSPMEFYLEVIDSSSYTLKKFTYPIFPKDIDLDAKIEYGEQVQGWLRFNAFSSANEDVYRLKNKMGLTGNLYAKVVAPNGSSLLHNLTLKYWPSGQIFENVLLNKWMLIKPDFKPDELLSMRLTYDTKGMDYFVYRLHSAKDYITEHLSAKIEINTDEFELFRFGIPNTIKTDYGKTHIDFELEHFATSQDLGITFDARNQHLNQIEKAIRYAPFSVGLFLILIMVFSQTRNVKFHPIHYIFITAIQLFYFIFLAYLIRFFGVWGTYLISIGASGAVAGFYFSNVFGRRFTLRLAGPLYLWLTLFFSLAFIMPIFSGISIALVLFLVLVGLMHEISKSNIEEWEILNPKPQTFSAHSQK